MGEAVWVSPAMMDQSLKMFMRNELEGNPNSPIDSGTRNEAGEPLAADSFPKQIWGIDEFDDTKSLPDLFFGYGPWVVSSAVATVMRQFELGAGGLYSVDIFKKDRTTRVGGEWFCVNFGNVKQVFRPEESTGARRAGPSGKRWRLPYVLKDDDLAVGRAALEGSDIWVDPAIKPAFFISNRLAESLKAADVHKPFGLRRCRVV